jgi:hypothetical protein
MPTFVFSYRNRPGTTGSPESAAAWMAWFRGMGDQLADLGNPAVDRAVLGDCGPGTQLGGYSLINAADLESAVAVAKGCPTLAAGGGVEVGLLGEVPSSVAAGSQPS